MLSSCTGVREVTVCFSSAVNCWSAIISRVQILLCTFQKKKIPNTNFPSWKDARAIITKQRRVWRLKEKRLFELHSWVSGYLIFLSFAPSWVLASYSLPLIQPLHSICSLFPATLSLSFSYILMKLWNIKQIFLVHILAFLQLLQGNKETSMSWHKCNKTCTYRHTHTCMYI